MPKLLWVAVGVSVGAGLWMFGRALRSASTVATPPGGVSSVPFAEGLALATATLAEAEETRTALDAMGASMQDRAQVDALIARVRELRATLLGTEAMTLEQLEELRSLSAQSTAWRRAVGA